MEQRPSVDSQTLNLRLRGDLTSSNAASLQAMAQLLQSAGAPDRKWQDVKLDLTEAKMIDSVGLNLIVAVFKAAKKGGGKLQLKYSDPNIYRTFTFTRLDKHLELVKA